MRRFLFATVVLALAAPCVMAQVSDSHTVTVTLSALDVIDVQGNVALTIILDPVTGTGTASDSSAVLGWITNQPNRQITVATDLAAAAINYPLQVTAQNIANTIGVAGQEGSAAGTVILSDTAQPFITGIDTAGGTCELLYEASATIASPVGLTDTHTVTYTLTGP